MAKKMPSLAVLMGPKKGPESEPEGNGEGLQAAMEDLAECIKAGDYAGAADAFRNAFELLETEPHDEADE